MSRLPVWDLPTRLFHWLFAAAFFAAYLLGEEEGWLGWHSYFGYLVAGLVLFRLAWGLVGGRYSRFSNFPPNPASAWRYLTGLMKGTAKRHVGHNPAGALAIYALLALGLATALSGMALLGADKGLGPLAGQVPGGWEDALEEMHEICVNAMLAVVALHLAGVIFGSLAHRENLPRSMLTGYKETSGQDAVPVQPAATVAVLMLAGVAAFTALHDFSAGCADRPAACAEGGDREKHGDDDHD